MRKYKPDTRTAEDIEAKIGELAKEYVPEWHFTLQDPDIGSTISRIFARQMQDSIRCVNHVSEIYHAEFVNFLDLNLRRAVPAGSIVCFEPMDSTVTGVRVPKGTQITTDEGGENSEMPPVFETDRELYVSSSRISDVFMTDREDGTIVPLKGDFEAPLLYEFTPKANSENKEITAGEEEVKNSELKPFVLFGGGEGIGRHALAIFHPGVFDVENESIDIRFEGAEPLCRHITSGELNFRWLSEDGLQDFDDMSVTSDGFFRLKKSDKCAKVTLDGAEQSVVLLESKKPITETLLDTDILLSSEGQARAAEYIGDGNREMQPGNFAPFTETLSAYAECYIGLEDYFDKAGALVHMDFHLSFLDHMIEITHEKEQEELKVIKRRSRAVREEAVSEAYADEIVIEYFNGIGWKYLNCDKEYRSLFASADNPGDHTLSFVCPPDWAETESGAYHGRLLRLRLLRSDNCYMRPAIHHYPQITELKFSYSYKGRELKPAVLKSLCGTTLTDLTSKSRQGEAFPIFTPMCYAEDAVYLGYDRALDNGPIGILFLLEGGAGQKGIDCRFEYSSRRGFKLLKVVDGTEGFTHSGIIMFIPPSDFAADTLEGKRRHWLRISRQTNQPLEERKHFMARILDIRTNAMTVTNAVSKDWDDVFLDETSAGMRHFLATPNILDTEVWVNERGNMSGDEMRLLAAEHPDEVTLETDLIGNIASCFVLWHEVEEFPEWDFSGEINESWDARRVYRIDRLSSEIIFGDGIHSAIPRVTDDVTFRIKIRSSAGERANVAPGVLTVLPEGLHFIDSVSNPVQAYGGSNMESVPQALLRGADRIYSRGRCVSANDYRRAILSFSNMIDKVGVIPGLTVDGKENASELSFALLMRDYKEGSFSFHRIEAQLKRYLLGRCELSVVPERLHIVEPVFAYVSVTVWMQVMSMDESFEVQNGIRELLDRYLDPVSGGSGEGWEIGTMPKKTQLILQLSGMKNQAMIRKLSITVRYIDHEGEHETDYEDLVTGPFMICRSGKHQVNIMINKDENDA